MVASSESGASRLRLSVSRTSCSAWHLFQIAESVESAASPTSSKRLRTSLSSVQNSAQGSACICWTSAWTCPMEFASGRIPITVLALASESKPFAQSVANFFRCPLQFWETELLETHLLFAVFHHAPIFLVELVFVLSIVVFDDRDLPASKRW